MNSRSEATPPGEQYSADGPGTPTGAALFGQAQAGCRDNLARLMAAHENLVRAVVRQQVLGDLPFAETLQAGRIGLWHAILGFDPQRGTAFSTYAWTCTMHRVWREIKLAERVQGQAASHPETEISARITQFEQGHLARSQRRSSLDHSGYDSDPPPRGSDPSRREAGR